MFVHWQVNRDVLLSGSLDFHSNVFAGTCVCVCPPLVSSLLPSSLASCHIVPSIRSLLESDWWSRALAEDFSKVCFVDRSNARKSSLLSSQLPFGWLRCPATAAVFDILFFFLFKYAPPGTFRYRTKGLGKRIIHHRDITEDLLSLSLLLSFFLFGSDSSKSKHFSIPPPSLSLFFLCLSTFNRKAVEAAKIRVPMKGKVTPIGREKKAIDRSARKEAKK